MFNTTVCQCGMQFFVFVCLFVFVVVVLFNTTVCQCGKFVCLFLTTLLFVSVVSRFCVKHCCMSVW